MYNKKEDKPIAGVIVDDSPEQEVEQVMPEAVITRPDGIKMVDYGVLNG